MVIYLLKRLAITGDYSTLSVVYEAPSKWIKFVWHEIELLSFFWRDRPYRFKVFGTIRHHPQLASCGNIIWVLAEMFVSKKDCFICSDGEKRCIGLTGPPPPCTWWKPGERLGISAIKTGQDVHHECDALESYREVIVFFWGLSFYSVPCMSGFIFNPSLLNWSSGILTALIYRANRHYKI